jgi:hypothetical protein
MTVLKRYIDGQWVTVVVGRQGDPGPPGEPGITSLIESFKGFWDSAETYNAGDVILYQGSTWISEFEDNLNNEPYWPFNPDVDEYYWAPLAIGGGGSGNSASSIDIEYRNTEYLPDGAITVLGAIPSHHGYSIQEEDIGKAIVVQRNPPYSEYDELEEELVNPGADFIYIQVPYGIGQIGDRVELAYTSSIVEDIENADLDIVNIIFDVSVNSFILPFSFDVDEDDIPVSGTVVLGDAIPLLIMSASSDPERWPPTSIARLTKVKTIETNLNESLSEPIPVDVWTAEIPSKKLFELSLGT